MTAREIAGLFDELELQLIASLKRNLARHKAQEEAEGGQNGVPEHWEAWQAAKLRDLRRFRRENQAILTEKAPIIEIESRRMILEQAREGGSNGFFGMNDRRVNALLEEMQSAQERAEKAALRYMDDVYRRTVRGAALGMAAGSMTLQQATDAATRDFLAAGINCIEYRDGRRVNIATYAEMALRTAGTRALLLGEARQREALGIDTVLVSQYGGCSDTCLPWQGLVYIDDVWQEYKGAGANQGGTYGYSRNGRSYPMLSVAVKAGLFHPNCRHILTTWVEGVSKRPKPMDKAKIEATSRLEAKQRELERKVRRAKREEAGLQEPEAVKAAKGRVRTAQKELREFVAQHGDVLWRDYWRERYDGVELPERAFAEQDFEDKPVTMQSIAAIKPVPSTLLSPENQQRLANVHKRLLMAVAKAPLGTEYGECYTLDMERLTPAPRAGETLGRVRLPDFEQPYVAIHNHPNGAMFSMSDMRQIINRFNMRILTAVGNDGAIYVVEKGAMFDDNAAKILIEEVKSRYPTWATDPNAHTEAVLEFLKGADQFGLYYTSTKN